MSSIRHHGSRKELLDHIWPLGSTNKKKFDGDYSNGSKQPDGRPQNSAINVLL
ncbi:hypothetical protein V1515DRAFT_612064 [Lipomyces mesembrius]